MVAGLEAPTRGRVYLEGNDVTTTAPERRSTSTVFQDYALFPHLTVLGNVLFPLRMKRLPKSEAIGKAREILQLVGLAGRENRKPNQLSGGQRQRVALARSLVWRPRALLLDEPLAALDFQLRQEMQQMLKELQSKVGITFMFVTHDQTEAFGLSDRIGVMNNGRLEQVGTPRELYNQPRTLFVATFLGNMNLIQGKVERSEKDGTVVHCGTFRVAGQPVSGLIPPGINVTVGIRPESIRQTSGHAGKVNTATCRVLSTTFQGSQEETLLEIAKGTTWRCYEERTTRSQDHRAGHTVTTTWDADDALIFADSNEEEKTLTHGP
jgi:ABC-type Fe3+/spermidine/putrescine transport system ATPase subunit